MGKSYAREGYLNENYRFFHLRDTAGQERDFHFHEFNKLVILRSGRVDYTVEDVTYPLRPGDVLLVKHHTIHKALIDQTVAYDRIILYLGSGFADRVLPQAGLMACFEAADHQGKHLLHPGEDQEAPLNRLLSALEQAQNDKSFGAEALRDTLVLQLLILLNRIMQESLPSAPVQDRHDPKITAALSYIHEHLAEELTVERLAEQVFLSKYHFMRLFKADTGTTVHAYIRQKRLLNACRLIRDGVPVNKAVTDCGFNDYSAFHRAFRDLFGTSPGRLKQQAGGE